jgi:hypothetical protein
LRVCRIRDWYLFSHANAITGDISKASAKVKSEIPGRGKEVQKDAEKWASEAGSKVDSAVSDPGYHPLYIAIYEMIPLLSFKPPQPCHGND